MDSAAFWTEYWKMMKFNTFSVERCPVVIFEGGIGVGKSTLVKEVAEYIGPRALPLIEPVPEDGTNPFLETFYRDKKRWSFAFQISQLSPRMELQLLAQYWALSGRGPALCDRSFYGDTCFARMLNKAKGEDGEPLMSDMEFAIYKKTYQTMTSFVMLPSLCVRLMASPETQAERIKRRAEANPERECEATVDADYLRALEDEIAHMVHVLKQQGTEVVDVLYDVELMNRDDRAQVVKSLADRILSWKPRDSFLDLHRRLVL